MIQPIETGVKPSGRARLFCIIAGLVWCCFGCRTVVDARATGATVNADRDRSAGSDTEAGVRSGEFSVLTYNIAGLPDFISSSKPARNTSAIGPKLNAYDLVLVQEDFWYHRDLIAHTNHEYFSMPIVYRPRLVRIGDGLNRFSRFPFSDLSRATWRQCNGFLAASSDCLAQKGFSVAPTELRKGVIVYVYNLHMDAGGNEADISTRRLQAEQLAFDIAARTGVEAVIVAGDTNLKHSRPGDMETLTWFLSATGLVDVCRALACPEESIDRVLFRSSESLALRPLTWKRPEGFVDRDGVDLSDHEPVAVDFRWASED